MLAERRFQMSEELAPKRGRADRKGLVGISVLIGQRL